MSFWNEDNYKVKLVDFTERFIPHNRLVRLYTTERKQDEQGLMVTEWTKIWQGMDWQITEGYADSSYFKMHPDVLPCPYPQVNVIAVTNFGTASDCADEVSLIVEKEQK